MASVSLSIGQNRFEKVKEILSGIPGGAEKAISRALNRALESARAELSREVRERYTISPSKFNQSVKVIKATPQKLVATLISTGARHPISTFKLAPNRVPEQKFIPVKLRNKGATTEIVQGVSKLWSHAFLARMRSGHLGLFKRSKEFKTSKKRPTIVEITSLSTPQMIGYNAILTEGLDIAEANLDKQLARQIDFILKGGGA